MKILLSPGYGAGWSSWADDEIKRYVLTYAPLIEAIESGNQEAKETAREQLQADLNANFETTDGENVYFYGGGFDQLEVREVNPPFLVAEYDGHEYIETPGAANWIME